ncbi:LppU/SCO3897 family protein [Actinokineospora sp.]|uniref:LppU/SCO3897 family protein n=1 Tax=Actinokineospora sp. TaxID=1872133 RepID=UPI003D6B94B5
MLNAKQGECFTDLEEADQAKKVACTDPAVKFEVLEIVDGGTQPEDCASSEVDDGFIYTEPKLVICGKSRK